MKPGKPQILTCPHCGGEKQIMSIVSGNTFGAEYWSDNKVIAPMYPEISLVQKCPHCGKYYLKSHQEVRYAAKGYSFELGLLTFPEMKEAFTQLASEGFRDFQEELLVRLMLFHSFNDFYYRSDAGVEVNPDDFALFAEQGRWLIENHWKDGLLKAEILREIGDFEQAKTIAGTILIENVSQRRIAFSILERIMDKDKRVFRIS